jgi:hypothetical protein
VILTMRWMLTEKSSDISFIDGLVLVGCCIKSSVDRFGQMLSDGCNKTSSFFCLSFVQNARLGGVIFSV